MIDAVGSDGYANLRIANNKIKWEDPIRKGGIFIDYSITQSTPENPVIGFFEKAKKKYIQ